ncbi:hypothetical protein [Saccharothrix syringae]|uniref:Uncharacterized protein n=1 Tax=Saccharothrix syringae TaxID=103733 RepID=A0A5Q0GU00_SACSY|nr:hypothetical protein [Saccharothrix syringae]QFZ17537.1 hypothetical protein EKG83_08630 [Saccharothrix syringae]
MRNVKVAVALAVLALAGCTAGNESPAPGGTTSSSASTTLSPGSSTAPTSGSRPGPTTPAPVPPPQSTPPPLPGGETEVPGAQVDGGTLPDTYERQAWTSADGRVLRVVGLAGGCKTASAEVTAQSADQVRITLVTTYYPPAEGTACTQELRDVPLDVTLDAPLGDRLVVLETREQTA